MTISKTAREIAEEFCRSNDRSVDELERAILRHMEHHLVKIGQERDHYKELWEASQSVNAALMRDNDDWKIY